MQIRGFLEGLSPAVDRSVKIATTASTPAGLRARVRRFFPFGSSPASEGRVESASAGASAGAAAVVEATDDGQLKSKGSTMATSPTYFISHGSPMLLCPEITGDMPARNFMKSFGQTVERPKAILAISAHWDTYVPTVTSAAKQDTIYDFGGFPRDLYKIKYDCPGSPAIAKRVVELLTAAGIEGARMDPRRGLDHGSWVPLLLMYPEKDIPVVQLSIMNRKDGAYHYAMGQALAPLREEGVVIMGLGNTTHNMRDFDRFHTGPPAGWALAFDKWLNDSLSKKRHDDVMRYLETAPYARKAHPTPDHFLPLIVALGAAGKDCDTEVVHHSWEVGTFSMASFAFHSATSS